MDAVLYIYNVDILVHKMFGAKKNSFKKWQLWERGYRSKVIIKYTSFLCIIGHQIIIFQQWWDLAIRFVVKNTVWDFPKISNV